MKLQKNHTYLLKDTSNFGGNIFKIEVLNITEKCYYIAVETPNNTHCSHHYYYELINYYDSKIDIIEDLGKIELPICQPIEKLDPIFGGFWGDTSHGGRVDCFSGMPTARYNKIDIEKYITKEPIWGLEKEILEHDHIEYKFSSKYDIPVKHLDELSKYISKFFID